MSGAPAPGGRGRPPWGRRLGVLAVVVAIGVGAAAGGIAWWTLWRDPVGPTTTTVGVGAAESLTQPSDDDALAPPSTTPPPSTGPTSAAPPSSTRPAPPAGSVGGPDTPVGIVLPSLGLNAPVVPVGVEDDGLMEVPEDVRTVGWYRFGPPPGGAAGSAVLSGHVNDRVQGAGVFARIGELQVGETVEVLMGDGRALRYRIVAREQWPKGQVPLDRLFDRGGQPRIVLVTCGGIFDRGSRNYQDNIAVTAVPDGPP